MAHYEPGIYRARIVAQGFSESKQKSTPFFFLHIEVVSAAGPNRMPSKAYQRTIDWYCTENTIGFVLEKLRRLGWTGSKMAELAPGHPQHHSFVGDEIDVECKIENEYDRFDIVAGSSGSGAAPEAKQGIASKLDKLFGKAIAASATSKKPKSEPPAKEKQEAVEEEYEDAIPF